MDEDMFTDDEIAAALADIDVIPVHGVLAPEGSPSGDGRGFAPGALTARPLSLPLMYQRQSAGGHDQSVLVGSIDRLMRKDGLVHWEGGLLDNLDASDVVDIVSHFGRFGLSLDGDNVVVDEDMTDFDEGVSNGVWMGALRVMGATIVAFPAFHEAYIALGPHPTMPEGDETPEGVLMAGASRFGEFKRGAGWGSHPEQTNRLHSYWTKPGEPGYQKIRWGTPGDFRRARRLIGEKIAKNSPEKMKYLNQIIAQWHYDALGYWPGEKGKPGNAPKTVKASTRSSGEGVSLTAFAISQMAEDDPLRGEAVCLHEGCSASGEYIVSSSDPGMDGIFCSDHAPEHENEPLPERVMGDWEVVLTSSATGQRVLPPAEYFERHPDTGALTILPPDENGIRRTFGYAGRWGVCHVGFENRCVELPKDPTNGYEEFHLGKTETDSGVLPTGLITYNKQHRGAEQILTEAATQAHFDDLRSAWAAVRLGEDEHGVWFSGVVLPGVPEDDIVRIAAAGQVSGEWKYGALRTLLTVNVPGFPVLQSSVAFDGDGEVVALAASAHPETVEINGVEQAPCSDSEDGESDVSEPTPAERVEALRKADALARIEKIKKEMA